MQKKLKLATAITAIFVILVFGIKYFYTTNKFFVSSYYDSPEMQDYYAERAEEAENVENRTDSENNSDHNNPYMEDFDYNIPITAVDIKALKRDPQKKLSYSNYEDRVRMSSPSKLDANGLYVALMQAVGDNDIERAKTLINKGAILNSPDGNTSYAPIFWAISNGNVEMVELLLQKGAKVNTPDEKGLFPIHWIVENSANRSLVYQMKPIFDLLLASNPGEINRQDLTLKQTPLMLSVSLNNKKAFAYLLDGGANVKIIDADKRDVTDFALEQACHSCIYLLESKEKQNQITPLPNFASTFTAPDPIWLPYSVTNNSTKKKTQKKNPNEIVIQGDSLTIPTYRQMPDILPLKKEQEINMVIAD